MRLEEKVSAAVDWVQTRRVALLAASFFVFASSLFGWYLVDSMQQTPRSLSERSSQLQPQLPAADNKKIIINNDTLEILSQSETAPPVTTRIRVNGQSTQPPRTAEVHAVTQDPDGTTTVTISVDANSSGTSSTDSSTSIELNSTTEVESSSETSQ